MLKYLRLSVTYSYISPVLLDGWAVNTDTRAAQDNTIVIICRSMSVKVVIVASWIAECHIVRLIGHTMTAAGRFGTLAVLSVRAVVKRIVIFSQEHPDP